MAADVEPTVFGPKATEQIAKTVREVSRRMMNEQPHRARWQQHPGGGGLRIKFEIVEVHCPDAYDAELYVLVDWTWYTGGCSSTPPGTDDDGYLTVYDDCILDFYTSDSLLGKTGSATYFYPRDAAVCEPRWIVDSICGQPECDQ